MTFFSIFLQFITFMSFLSQEYLEELTNKGHNLTLNTFLPVSDSVSREENYVIYGVGDYRRLGGSDGL